MTMPKYPNPILSGQAEWHLNGLKHTHICYAETCEPNALQELMDKELVTKHQTAMDRTIYYKITEKGQEWER